MESASPSHSMCGHKSGLGQSRNEAKNKDGRGAWCLVGSEGVAGRSRRSADLGVWRVRGCGGLLGDQLSSGPWPSSSRVAMRDDENVQRRRTLRAQNVRARARDVSGQQHGPIGDAAGHGHRQLPYAIRPRRAYLAIRCYGVALIIQNIASVF